MMSENYINTDFERAKSYYSTAPPMVRGRLTMSQDSAESMPISLDEVYGVTFETIDSAPRQAQKWAKTFGALSVGVALDARPTSFQFEDTSSFRPADTAEIATLARLPLTELLSVTEQDSSLAFLLASDEQPVPVEMALIQALHMVDTAIVTGQYDGRIPLLRACTTSGLEKLRQDYPEVFLRSYGNVRNLSEAPNLLGSVVPTLILEKSGVDTVGLDSSPHPQIRVRPQEEISPQSRAVFAGVTTAKKPHIGHGLLLVKAIAEVPQGGRLLVELNDRGPRVAQALAALAIDRETTFDSIAAQVSDGSIDMQEIEKAYKERSGAPVPDELPFYKLDGPNEYYRDLLGKILPPDLPSEVVADSELPPAQPTLGANRAYVPLFGASGMAILRGQESKAVVTEQKGELTVAGILAVLSSRYALKLVDSPPPLSTSERAIFKDAGLGVEQSSGTGFMVDFEVASGTKGTATSMDEFLELTIDKTGNPGLLLPSLREMMNGAYFLPSEGASISANFASNGAAMSAYQSALEKVAGLEDPYSLLYKPLSFKDVKREVLQDLLYPVYAGDIPKAKPKAGEIRRLLEYVPSLGGRFSKSAMDFVSDKGVTEDRVINKNLLDQNDRQIIQTLRLPIPERVISLLLELNEQTPEGFMELVERSQLADIIQAMGYQACDAANFLNRLNSVKGVYKAQ